MAITPQPGSLYVVDYFNSRNTAHGDHVGRAAQHEGFSGTIVEQQRAQQLELDAGLSEPGMAKDTFKKALQEDMLNVQLNTLRNATGELRRLQDAGVHHSAINFSSGMSKASMVDQYYKAMEPAWSNQALDKFEHGPKRDEAEARATQLFDNFAKAHGRTREGLLELPQAELDKLLKGTLAKHVERSWANGGEAVQQARADYRQAVIDVEKNHNSVVVAAENSGDVRSTGSADFYDNVLANDQTTNVGAVTHDGRQVESYSNPSRLVDLHARGTSPQTANPGTSYAAPRVAAALAKAHQLNQQMSSEEAERLVVDQLTSPVQGGAVALDPQKAREYLGR